MPKTGRFGLRAALGLLLSAAAIGAACGADTARESRSESRSTEAMSEESVAPTTTIDAEYEAALEEIEAATAECPALEAAMIDHFERSSQLMSCADFTAFQEAVLAELIAEELAEQQREFEEAVAEEMRAEARAREREIAEYEEAIRAELRAEAERQRQQEFEEAVALEIQRQMAEAQLQGDALVRRSCPGGGTYSYRIDPVQVRLVSCDPIAPSAPATQSCDPNYTGCVPIASDVDCAGGSGNGPAYTGRVRVIGRDIYDLDRDGDGIACE